MIKNLVLAIALIAHLEIAGAKDLCANLVGVWRGQDTYEDREITTRWILKRESDGWWSIEHHANSRSGELITQREGGKWTCEGDELQVRVLFVGDELMDHRNVYKILQAKKRFNRLQIIEGIPEVGKIFESHRVEPKP